MPPYQNPVIIYPEHARKVQIGTSPQPQGGDNMAIIFSIMLLSLILFGRAIEQRIDARIGRIYETGIDDDPWKTCLTIHFYDIWMGFASYFCLASAVESLGAKNYIFGLVAIVAFAICAKITRMFYHVSAARERALARVLSTH